MEVGQDLRTLWRTLEPRPLTRSPRLRRQHVLLTVAVELTHEIPYCPPNVKGKILRSTKPNKPVKTMNKKIGRRRKHFPFSCVKVETVVTKCSWRWLWFQIVL